MLVGAILAVTQTDIKRLLAYSSIANAGYLLVGVLAFSQDGLSSSMFYLVAYGFTVIAAFARGHAGPRRRRRGHPPVPLGRAGPALAAVRRRVHVPPAGLRRHPADQRLHQQVRGVRRRRSDGGQTWLVIAGVVTSMILAFPYLRVVVMMWLSEPGEYDARRCRSRAR